MQHMLTSAQVTQCIIWLAPILTVGKACKNLSDGARGKDEHVTDSEYVKGPQSEESNCLGAQNTNSWKVDAIFNHDFIKIKRNKRDALLT